MFLKNTLPQLLAQTQTGLEILQEFQVKFGQPEFQNIVYWSFIGFLVSLPAYIFWYIAWRFSGKVQKNISFFELNGKFSQIQFSRQLHFERLQNPDPSDLQKKWASMLWPLWKFQNYPKDSGIEKGEDNLNFRFWTLIIKNKIGGHFMLLHNRKMADIYIQKEFRKVFEADILDLYNVRKLYINPNINPQFMKLFENKINLLCLKYNSNYKIRKSEKNGLFIEIKEISNYNSRLNFWNELNLSLKQLFRIDKNILSVTENIDETELCFKEFPDLELINEDGVENITEKAAKKLLQKDEEVINLIEASTPLDVIPSSGKLRESKIKWGGGELKVYGLPIAPLAADLSFNNQDPKIINTPSQLVNLFSELKKMNADFIIYEQLLSPRKYNPGDDLIEYRTNLISEYKEENELKKVDPAVVLAPGTNENRNYSAGQAIANNSVYYNCMHKLFVFDKTVPDSYKDLPFKYFKDTMKEGPIKQALDEFEWKSAFDWSGATENHDSGITMVDNNDPEWDGKLDPHPLYRIIKGLPNYKAYIENGISQFAIKHNAKDREDLLLENLKGMSESTEPYLISSINAAQTWFPMPVDNNEFGYKVNGISKLKIYLYPDLFLDPDEIIKNNQKEYDN